MCLTKKGIPRLMSAKAYACSHFGLLVRHAGLWASLLGPRLFEFKKGKVLRPVVELADNLQDALEALALQLEEHVLHSFGQADPEAIDVQLKVLDRFKGQVSPTSATAPVSSRA